MSDQDKEMEAAAREYATYYERVNGMDYRDVDQKAVQDFKAGWKAASERKDVELKAWAGKHADITIEWIALRDSLQSKLATAEALIAKIAHLERDSIGSEHFGDRVYYAMKLYREGK
jgi:hypothetical protein